MKKYIIILALVIALLSATTWQYFMNNDKTPSIENVTINTNDSAPTEKQTIEKPLELIDPTDDQNNEYILEQLASLGLDSEALNDDSTNVSEALTQMGEAEASITQSTATIIEPRPEITTGPIKRPEFDQGESEEDLIKRLAKQTGMSEVEIREAFKGQ